MTTDDFDRLLNEYRPGDNIDNKLIIHTPCGLPVGICVCEGAIGLAEKPEAEK